MNNLYEDDYYRWTKEQKKILQSGNLSNLDVENLIEELEEMGRSDYDTLVFRIKVLIIHLLKYNYQKSVLDNPVIEKYVLRGWRNSIHGPRDDIKTVILKNPSLKSKLEECLEKGYRLGKRLAIKEMNDYIDIKTKKLNDKSFPKKCPWSFEKITEDNWLPEEKLGDNDE